MGGKKRATVKIDADAIVGALGRDEPHYDNLRDFIVSMLGSKHCDDAVRRAIHSTRSRLKSETSIRRKIQLNFVEKKRPLTIKNYRQKIEDYAGVRILTLYRHHIPLVHRWITTTSLWRTLKTPEGYAFDQRDVDAFAALNNIRVKKKKHPYTSIHYIIAMATGPNVPRCEVQLRSLHLEGWAEVDHELKYPDKKPSEHVSQLLEALHSVVGVADWLAELSVNATRAEKEIQEREERYEELVEGLLAKLKEAEAATTKAKRDKAMSDLGASVEVLKDYKPVSAEQFLLYSNPSLYSSPLSFSETQVKFGSSLHGTTPVTGTMFPLTTAPVEVGSLTFGPSCSVCLNVLSATEAARVRNQFSARAVCDNCKSNGYV